MNLIPDEELQTKSFVNLTPMVDFLFLVIAIFAVLAVTRTALFDSEISLAKVTEVKTLEEAKKIHVINLSITENGTYKWITEFNEYAMDGVASVLQELSKQETLGTISKDKSETKILLHIDKAASWDSVATLVCSLKKTGHLVHPVYELETTN